MKCAIIILFIVLILEELAGTADTLQTKYFIQLHYKCISPLNTFRPSW